MSTTVRAASPPLRTTSRLVGVDAARGLALVAMMSVHVLPLRDGAGSVTLAHRVAGGTSAAAFAVLAGVGLALAHGRRSPLRAASLPGAGAGLTVRALSVLAVGLALGSFDSGLAVILAYYGVLFVLAIPLLGLPTRVVAAVAVASAVLLPLLSYALRDGLPPPERANPTLEQLAHPWDLLSVLTVTGYYPALPWVAYLAAGIAVGRCDLGARRVQALLVAGGATLAAAASGLSALLLGPLGGYRALLAVSPDVADTEGLRQQLAGGVFGNTPTTSPWWLAVTAPHSTTPLDLLRTIGTSLALLGVLLLLARVVRPLLGPLAAAGGMTLTLYSLHVAVRASPLLPADPQASLLLQVGVALVLATGWRAVLGRGPLEAAVARLSGLGRRAVDGLAPAGREVLPAPLGEPEEGVSREAGPGR